MPRAASIKHQKHQFFNNSGGMNTKSALLSMPVTDSPDILNVDLDKTGSFKKRKGWQNFTLAPIGGGTRILGIFRLVKKTGASYLIAAEGTKIYEDAATGDITTERATGLSDQYWWSGQAYNDNLYLANGYDKVKVYSGGAAITNLEDASGVSLPAAWSGTDQPSWLQLTLAGRAERMAACGLPSDPSRVWFSAIQDPLDWTTSDNAFNILVLKDNGEPVTSVAPLYDLTICFKKSQTAVYAGDGVDTFQLVQPFFSIGCPAPRSIVHVGRDLYFWSQKGPAQASGVQEYGDISPVPISIKIEDEIAAINWGYASQIVGVHDNQRDRILWFVPGGGHYQNTKVFVYYYDSGAWAIYDNVGAHSALTYEEDGARSVYYLGDYNGNINQFGQQYSDDGGAYTSRYITPWYDFGDFGRRDRVLEIRFANGKDGYDVNVYYQYDQIADWTLAGNLKDFIAQGTAIWGRVNWGDFTWGEGQQGLVRIRPHGSGRIFRMKFENTTANTSFEILGYSITTAPMGER